MKSKKGITPIIAVILLLMMTVAAAGAAFFWFVRIQSEMQGGTESYQQELTEKISSKVEIITTKYAGGDLDIYIRNIGNAAIPLDDTTSARTTTWILFDSENNIVCSSDWSGNSGADCTTGCSTDLEPGEIRKIVLDLSSPCNNIANSSYTDDSMFSYKIEFSGKTGTGAQFIK